MRKFFWIMIVGALLLFFSAPLLEAARIKDLASIEGVRENQLIGYGLVIGLNGTGDKAEFAIQSLKNMLIRMGLTITVEPKQIRVKNVAAVMVTAKLPPFAREGSHIDVLVSSVGDATSLQGGTLLLTPLKAPDQEVYAVAQGPISIGGFLGGGPGATVQKNHTTAGSIAGGAIVEKEVGVDLSHKEAVTIALHRPDFTTAARLAEAINAKIEGGLATPLDSGTVQLKVSEPFREKIVELVASIESLEVTTDVPARVILNERTGTIVIGENVRISPVAIAHGNLTIKVQVGLGVSQPGPFSRGETVIVPETETEVAEQEASMIQLAPGVSLGEVVKGLNAVGATPRDLVAILQALKAAGALQAELELI